MTWQLGFAPTSRGPVHLISESQTGESAYFDMVTFCVNRDYDGVYDPDGAMARCIIRGGGLDFYAWRVLHNDNFEHWNARWGDFLQQALTEGVVYVADGSRGSIVNDPKWMVVLRKSKRGASITGYTRTRPYKSLTLFWLGDLRAETVTRCLIRPVRGARSNPCLTC